MKKEDVTSLILYVVLMALVLVFGLTVLKGRVVDSSIVGQGAYIGYLIGAVIVGIIFNAILFEVAHLIGAKLGRYEVLVFNILYFCFYKENGKFRFRFKSYEGLTGETKILPKKDAKKTPNPTAFLTLGSLFYLIEGITFMTIYALFVVRPEAGAANPVNADIGYFLLIVAFVGFLIFLYNIVPFKLDSVTDGYRLTLVSNPKNKVAFNELLRVEYEIANGNENVEIMTFQDITNFTADLNLNKVYLLLKDEKYAEAEPLINDIINAKKNISNRVYIDAISQLIFIKFMTLSLEEANKYLEENIDRDTKREISSARSMVASRAYILIEGLIDNSQHECMLTISNIQKSFKATSKARQAIEIKLFNLALDKVIEKHPKWNFETYRLVETKDSKNVEIKGDETSGEVKETKVEETKPEETKTEESSNKDE